MVIQTINGFHLPHYTYGQPYQIIYITKAPIQIISYTVDNYYRYRLHTGQFTSGLTTYILQITRVNTYAEPRPKLTPYLADFIFPFNLPQSPHAGITGQNNANFKSRLRTKSTWKYTVNNNDYISNQNDYNSYNLTQPVSNTKGLHIKRVYTNLNVNTLPTVTYRPSKIIEREQFQYITSLSKYGF